MRHVAAALVHYPVLDRQGEVVTSAITNIDLHDISRSALTYGLRDFFIVHPIAAQRELADRVKQHWVEGAGGRRIPDRKPAMGIVRVVSSIAEASEQLSAQGGPIELWTTAARAVPGETLLSFAVGRQLLAELGPPVLICFGTGWGLAPELHAKASRRVEPIASGRTDGYNHLSVRAAAAIIFDRLLRGDER
jgi:hypothetical protein